MRIAIGFVVAAMGLGGVPAFAMAADTCPGVNSTTGLQPPRVPAAATTPSLPAERPIPAAWRSQVLQLLARAEAGSPNLTAAYQNVSTTDLLSVGFLQWNHNTSLYNTFLRNAGPEFIAAAPELIRSGISTLVAVGNGTKPKSDGEAVIRSWYTPKGTIKPEVRSALQTWLSSEPLMKRQNQLLDATLQRSLSYADAWVRDWGHAQDSTAAQRAFYYFADVITFSGGLDGLWVGHVKEFEKGFASRKEMLAYMLDWANRCEAFVHTGIVNSSSGDFYPKYNKLYRRPETILSLKEWASLSEKNDPRVDDDAVRLIVLGYLRAIRSTGTDKPKGFHGVFQADVLNRRGMMATGVGVLSGETKPTVIYTLQ